MNTLLYVYLISARGNFFQRNTRVHTYGMHLLQCCRKMMPSAPTPRPPCHMMPLFISARLYFYVSQNSFPLSEFKGNHSRLIWKEFVWRIHLWRDPWNHRNYTDRLFLHAGELQLKPSASNSPLACVKLVFESGIIQWAPQETFIWLSLCFLASATPSLAPYSGTCVRGRNESPPGDFAADLLHLHSIYIASTGKEAQAVNSNSTAVQRGGG